MQFGRVKGLAVWTFAATVLVAATAAAAPDLAAMQKKLAKYADEPSSGKIHGVCVCQDGSEKLHNRAGYLLQHERNFEHPVHGTLVDVVVRCQVEHFDLDGSPNNSDACWTFVPLAK
jgi:hypothetical protein